MTRVHQDRPWCAAAKLHLETCDHPRHFVENERGRLMRCPCYQRAQQAQAEAYPERRCVICHKALTKNQRYACSLDHRSAHRRRLERQSPHHGKGSFWTKAAVQGR